MDDGNWLCSYEEERLHNRHTTCSTICLLQHQLQTFMDITFENITNTERALDMLKKFERLGIPDLGTDDKYQVILQNYGHDIEMVSKLYTKQKNDPPVARNLPPVAGKILWARQLFLRIQSPMSLFQQHPTVLRATGARPIIRNYNRVAKALLEFEVVYHRGWLQQVELMKAGLKVSLLVKAPETGEIFVNFDPEILTLIRETECMSRMELEIPPFAAALQQKRDTYKETFNKLQMMLSEYKRVKSKIPAPLHTLMTFHLAKVDDAMQPGLTTLSWTSLNIKKYLQNVLDKIADLELLLDRVNDLIEFRINAVLQEMSCMPLCSLPEEEPLTCEEFLRKTKELCISGARTLHLKSSLVEEAANELINTLLDVEVQIKGDIDDKPPNRSRTEEVTEEEGPSDPFASSSPRAGQMSGLSSPLTKRKKKEIEMLEEEAQELLSHFSHHNIDSLLKVTRNTLEAMRKRVQASSVITFLDNKSVSKQKLSVQPIFKASIFLSIPNFAMVPALDEVQQTLNKAVDSIVNVMKGVGQWSKERLSKKKILERKIAALRSDGDSENEMRETETGNIHADLKLALTAETKAWMTAFGRCCNKKYRSEMENIFAFVEEINKKLNRQIKDLDDIRIAMAALKDIREQQIPIDFQVGPIEESYAVLNKYGLLVAKEEMEKVDTLRYSWEKLLVRANEVQNELVGLQPKFRGELISTVETFAEDCDHYYLDYDKVYYSWSQD
ncbi:UNVERIFIED_CONTAM: hypothetical protein K2H54_062241 [Gekko kuhli]